MGGSLALLRQTIRSDTRAWSTYALRMMLFFALVIAVYAAYQGSSQKAAPGLMLFQVVFHADIAIILLASLGLFATAISEEKEAGSLPLLRLTGMSPTSLVLSKYGSRALSLGLLLSAQLPFTMFGIALGGLSLEQLVWGYAMIVCFALSATSLATLASVLARRAGGAVGLTLLLLLGAYVGATIVAAPLSLVLPHGSLRSLRPLIEGQISFFAAAPLNMMIEDHTDWRFYARVCLAGNLTVGLLALYIAVRRFDSSADRAEDAETERQLTVKLKLTKATTKGGSLRSWSAALAWKEFRLNGGGWPLFAVRCCAAVGLVLYCFLNWRAYGYYSSRNIGSLSVFGESITGTLPFVTATLALVALTLDAAFLASRIANREIREQTLTSLTMLPLSLQGLMMRKWQGCLVTLSPWLTVVLFATLADPGSFSRAAGSFSGSLELLALLALTLFLVQLSFYLSLTLPWGAFFAALALTGLGLFLVGQGAGGLLVGVLVVGLVLGIAFRKRLDWGALLARDTLDVDRSSPAVNVISALFGIGLLFGLLALFGEHLTTFGSFRRWVSAIRTVFLGSLSDTLTILGYLGLHVVIYAGARRLMGIRGAANVVGLFSLVSLQVLLQSYLPSYGRRDASLSLGIAIVFFGYATALMQAHGFRILERRAAE